MEENRDNEEGKVEKNQPNSNTCGIDLKKWLRKSCGMGEYRRQKTKDRIINPNPSNTKKGKERRPTRRYGR